MALGSFASRGRTSCQTCSTRIAQKGSLPVGRRERAPRACCRRGGKVRTTQLFSRPPEDLPEQRTCQVPRRQQPVMGSYTYGGQLFVQTCPTGVRAIYHSAARLFGRMSPVGPSRPFAPPHGVGR